MIEKGHSILQALALINPLGKLHGRRIVPAPHFDSDSLHSLNHFINKLSQNKRTTKQSAGVLTHGWF